MTEVLHHDPRTKQQIKDMLYKHLYEPLQLKFARQLEGIVVKNAVLRGYGHRSFVYKGVLYNCDVAGSPPPRPANRLDPKLVQEMADYLAEQHRMNTEELPFVMGYINRVLNTSNDLHDYLRLLPDSLHGPIRGLIDSCPCRGVHLTNDTVAQFHERNADAIQLVKQRMVTNLLI